MQARRWISACPRVLEPLLAGTSGSCSCTLDACRLMGGLWGAGSLEVGRCRDVLLIEDGHLRTECVADPGHVAGLEEHARLVLRVRRPVGLHRGLRDGVGADADRGLRIRVVVVRKVDPVPLALRLQLAGIGVIGYTDRRGGRSEFGTDWNHAWNE